MLDIARDAVTDERATNDFADIVCADPVWLDAEFDAIVAANFGACLPCPPRRSPRPGSAGPRHPRPSWSLGRDEWLIGTVRDARPHGRRQRSPPLTGLTGMCPACGVHG